jgi:ABC-type multidrug transport system ATPase subunit
MEVNLTAIGKRFTSKWIFRNLSFCIRGGEHNAIVGKNGSGKSTLLLIAAGYLSPSAGTLQWTAQGRQISQDDVFKKIAIASPYLELIEEFTLAEAISFQQKFKPFINSYTNKEILEISGLSDNSSKQLKHFSSGMKQRCKLVLAIMCDSPLLLLDEPCSNLDSDSVSWYQQMVENYCNNRTLLICSNHNLEEYHKADIVCSL